MSCFIYVLLNRGLTVIYFQDILDLTILQWKDAANWKRTRVVLFSGRWSVAALTINISVKFRRPVSRRGTGNFRTKLLPLSKMANN